MGLLDEAGRRLQSLLDRTQLDEKAAAAARTVKQKGQELLDKAKLDEKAAAAGRAVSGAVEAAKRKGRELLDRTDPGGRATGGADTLHRRMDQLLHGNETAGPAPEERKPRTYGIRADVPVLTVEPEEPEETEEPEEPEEP